MYKDEVTEAGCGRMGSQRVWCARMGVTEAGCGRNGSTEVKVWKDWASNSQRAQDLKQEIRMFHGISLPSIVSTD